MRSRLATPEFVIVAALVALIAGGLAFGGKKGSGGSADADAGAKAAAARVAPIARRVETIRALRFKQIPKPLIVSPAQTRRDSLADLDRKGSAAALRTGAQVLELMGLLAPGTDLRKVEGDISGGEVAGYYDTRRKRLAIVSGPAAGGGVLAEITLAHELDHALEDQAIGLKDESSSGADDGSSAYTALVEGSATSVMDDYTRRFVNPGAALGSAFSTLGPSADASKSIPPYLMASLLFSYVSGERFVNRLRAVAHGWKLVDYALRKRPPDSTEQVIHPEKYLVDERPDPIRLSAVASRVPKGWKRETGGTIGEFDTDQLLKLGVPDIPAGDAAAGWGGGRYELWAPPGVKGCASPCRRRSALVVSWAWDTIADARQFDAALRSYLVKGVSARAAGADAWHVGDGAAAVSPGRLTTTLAFAPDVAAARRVASGALGR